jgi:hypothetical protein
MAIPSRPKREGFAADLGPGRPSPRDLNWEMQSQFGGLGTQVPPYVPAKRMSPRWRSRLRIASFKGAPFYVDQQGRSSGRRTVVHEYP